MLSLKTVVILLKETSLLTSQIHYSTLSVINQKATLKWHSWSYNIKVQDKTLKKSVLNL